MFGPSPNGKELTKFNVCIEDMRMLWYMDGHTEQDKVLG